MAHPITGFDKVSNSIFTHFVSFVFFVVNIFRLFFQSYKERSP
jgi:hypothetical protein